MEARSAASPTERRSDHPFRGACGAAAPGLGCAAPVLRWAVRPGRGAGAEPRRRRPPPLHPLLFRPAPLPPPPPLPLASLTARPGPRRPPPPLPCRHFLSQAGPGRGGCGAPAAGAAPLRGAAAPGGPGRAQVRARTPHGAGKEFLFYSLPLYAPPYRCASPG